MLLICEMIRNGIDCHNFDYLKHKDEYIHAASEWKQCKMKIGRYYISESAKEMYGDWRFITISIKEDVAYDIKF